MPYALIIDIVVAVLLIVTIGYAIRLNKRLGLLRKDRGELEKLAVTFADSTIRADESLGRLRTTAEILQKRLDAGQSLHDDLQFLTERGEATADRLEELVRSARSQGAGVNPGNASSSAKQSKSDVAAATRPPLKSSTGNTTSQAGTIPAAPVVRPEEKGINEDLSSRSEAERELLKALRSVK